MSKFKIGEEVVIVKSTRSSYWYADKIGQKFTILDDDPQFNRCPFHVKLEYSRWAEEGDLVLASEYEKESTSAWLKENKWFIRTGSPEKSKLVQEWLFEHGMKWQWPWYTGFNNNTNEKLLTNTYDNGDKNDYILFGVDSNKTNAQEVTLGFETIVKSVKLPEVAPKKTEAQMKLEELQRTIEDAQRQIAGLKEEI